MESAQRTIRALIAAGDALANFDPQIDARVELEEAWATAKAEAKLLLPRPKQIGFFRHLVRGCGTLPQCGPHPGNAFLIVLVALGAAAGVKGGGLQGAVFGAGAMLLVFGSAYLCGAYGRSKDEESINQRNLT